MVGNQKFYLRVGKKIFDLILERNITIIKDNSATGKSTLIRYIQNHIIAVKNTGQSDVKIKCDKPFYVLNALNWDDAYVNTEKYKDSIIFIDEGNKFLTTVEFARFVDETMSFFVLITRETCGSLAYSVNSVCELECKNDVYKLKSKYNTEDFNLLEIPQLIITEDSESGFTFFNSISKDIKCKSAGNNSNIINTVLDSDQNLLLLIICDSAAFGAHYELLLKSIQDYNYKLFMPESFEYLILNSGLFTDELTQNILKNPGEYIDSDDYLTWERFFTNHLCKISKNTRLYYSKNKLNENYLESDTMCKILKSAGLDSLNRLKLAENGINKPVNKMNLF